MRIYVSAEDELSRAVVAKLADVVSEVEVNIVPLGHAHGGFGYIKKNLQKFCNLGVRERVIVLTDLDSAECPPSLRASWLASVPDFDDFPEYMVFCIAVREVEAWLMADFQAFATFFSVSPSAVRKGVINNVVNPKEHLVTTIRESSVRSIREAIVPDVRSKALVGLGYNQLLSQFVADVWMPERGASESPSLKRATDRIRALLRIAA